MMNNMWRMLSIVLCFVMSSAYPMQQKLTTLKQSLTSLKGGLEQLSTSLGNLKQKLGSGSTFTGDEKKVDKEAERKRLEAEEKARKAEQARLIEDARLQKEAEEAAQKAEEERLAEESRQKAEAEAKEEAKDVLSATNADQQIDTLTKPTTALKPNIAESIKKKVDQNLTRFTKSLKLLKENPEDKDALEAALTDYSELKPNLATGIFSDPIVKFLDIRLQNTEAREEAKRKAKREAEKKALEEADRKKKEEEEKKRLEAEANKKPRTGVIDFLEIPNFESFYQAFKKNYLESALSKQDYKKTDYLTFYNTYGMEIDARGIDIDIEKGKKVIEAMENYISRAIFEREILALCKQYIDDNDPSRDKSKSGNNKKWVYEQYLKNVIEKSDTIKKNLQKAADNAAEAVNDMFYHKERQEGRNKVSCDCLRTPLKKGYYTTGTENDAERRILDKNIDLRIPRTHALFNPINYLIFETMHVTLFHGWHFINKLILLFNFTKDIKADVSVENKKEFRIGFDGKVFDEIMTYIVGKEEEIKKPLLIDTQKDYAGKEVLVWDQKLKKNAPRNVIYGKKLDSGTDIYWCQTGHEKFPDGNTHSTTSGYQDKVTDDELRYALKCHIDRHTCYSVGLIPYDLVQVLKLEPEEEIAVTQKIADALVNENEKKRLNNKIKGLEIVIKVSEYLTDRLKGLVINEKKQKKSQVIRFLKGPKFIEFFGKEKIEELLKSERISGLLEEGKIKELFADDEVLALLNDSVVVNWLDSNEKAKKTYENDMEIAEEGYVSKSFISTMPTVFKNIDAQVKIGKEGVSLLSIKPNEWDQIFQRLDQDKDFSMLLKPIFTNKKVTDQLEIELKDTISQTQQEKKEGIPGTTVYQAITNAFNAINK